MDKKLVFFSLRGLLAGSAIAALAMHLTIKASPQASTNNTDLAQNQVTPLYQATPPRGTTPPFRPGMTGPGMMMGHSDQHFIVMMIPHHEGAVAMADLALSRAKHPELKKLAQAIKTTQTKEIQQMQAWYKQWYGANVPAWGAGTGCCMHGGGMGTNLSALQNAPDFDLEFIQQMIPHHQMGVNMASMVLYSSQRPEIRNLAQSIIQSQTDEINQMQQWYQKWSQS